MRDIGENWLEIGLHCKILRNIIKVDNKGIHLKKSFKYDNTVKYIKLLHNKKSLEVL